MKAENKKTGYKTKVMQPEEEKEKEKEDTMEGKVHFPGTAYRDGITVDEGEADTMTEKLSESDAKLEYGDKEEKKEEENEGGEG